jgi:hypothetical protein
LLREWLCKRFCGDAAMQLPATERVFVPPVGRGGAVDDAMTIVPGTTAVTPGATIIDPYRRGGAVIVDPTQRAVYSGPVSEQAIADRYNARARAGYVKPVNTIIAQQQPYNVVPYTDPVVGANTGALQTQPGQGGSICITPSQTTTYTGPACNTCATPACTTGYCGTACGTACGYGCASPTMYYGGGCAPCGSGTSWRPTRYMLPWRKHVANSLWGTSPCGPYAAPYGGCH